MPADRVRVFPHLSELLDQYADTSLLTPNRRLSRLLHHQHGLTQGQLGRRAWPSLRAYSLSGWLQMQWRNLQSQYNQNESSQSQKNGASEYALTELSPQQEQWLWYDIIRRDQDSLLVPERTARLAKDAWEIISHWRCPLESLPVDGEESSLFLRWAQQFQQHCRDHGLIDSHSLLEQLLSAFQSQRLAAPARLTLFGFDDFTPLQQALIGTLESQGCELQYCDVALNGSVQQIAFEDPLSELKAVARWALAQLRETRGKQTIGIVIPDLAKRRAQVETIFNQVFQPQAQLPEQPRQATPYNVSASIPLYDSALFRAAFACLELNYSALDKNKTAALLRSPFWGDEEELSARSGLAEQLRTQYSRITLSSLIQEASAVPRLKKGAEAKARCPLLHLRLQNFRRLGRHQQQRPSQWAQLFAQQLEIMGWPGSRTLDTIEYQQSQLFPELFEKMAALDAVSEGMDLADALKTFQQLGETGFQAKTKSSPIQILGLLEAAGQQFDCCWVLQMDNRHWPPAPTPNPLLPTWLQRERGMPHASAERELQFAQRLTERLAHSAKTVFFSYAHMEDNQSLEPSPLIKHFPRLNTEGVQLAEPINYIARIAAAGSLENFIDNYGPALTHHKAVGGGTNLLKDQAACAFKAFTHHRLRVRETDTLSEGISPLERGNLIHNSLEALWLKLENQATLLQQSEEQLQQLVARITERTWEKLKLPHRSTTIKQLEIERSQRLLQQWLLLERERPPFKVLINEGKQKVRLGKLHLTLRLDRVDELEDGSTLVIDYKTGKADPNSWLSERPDEPQMPLYCLTQDQRLVGAAYGQLSADNVAFRGIALSDDIVNGLREPGQISKLEKGTTWAQLLQNWQQVLQQLADRALAGEAGVDPKIPGVTCRHCSLQSFCRVKEYIAINEDELENLLAEGPGESE